MKASGNGAGPGALHRGLRGEAVLALWGGIEPGREDAFNDWYTHEHLPERIAVPGFLRARRYVSNLDDPRLAGWRYLTVYEIETAAILRSPAYLHALENPTEGTLRSLPLFRDISRMAGHVTHSAARGFGGDLFMAELGPRPGRADELRRRIADELSGRLLRRSGCLAVHLCERDEAGTEAGVSVASYRDVKTGTGRWLLLVEGSWPALGRAFDMLADEVARLAAHGRDERAALGLFRFLESLEP